MHEYHGSVEMKVFVMLTGLLLTLDEIELVFFFSHFSSIVNKT